MTAQPSRITADGKLRIQLAETYPGVEPIGVVLVRCRNWDGVESPVAFRGVVLLADDAGAAYVVIIVEPGGWFVSLQPQEPHRPERSLAYFLRWSEHFCSKPRQGQAPPTSTARVESGASGLG